MNALYRLLRILSLYWLVRSLPCGTTGRLLARRAADRGIRRLL